MSERADKHLKVALLHLAPRFGELEDNRKALIDAIVTASAQGARLVIAPELAISGYCFTNRAEAAAFSESTTGPTIRLLSETCRQLGVYCAVGFLERDETTGLLHNAVCVIDENGQLLARHRKLVAERHWATPGSPAPIELVTTPWGKLGLLVCADSYFALPARALALQGADLLIVVANWPPSGVDPRLLWRARALENGVGLLACNRTGVERRLSFADSSSFAVLPSGEVLLDRVCATPEILPIDWPLEAGRFFHQRRQALAGRRPEEWRSLGLDVNGLDSTTFLWGSPPKTPVRLTLCTDQRPTSLASNTTRVHVWVVPWKTNAETELSRFVTAAPNRVVAGADEAGPYIATSDEVRYAPPGGHLLLCIHGLRLAVAEPSILRHPEVAVVLAKEGCDLLVLPARRENTVLANIIATRCVERIPIVLASPDRTRFFLPPVGHESWQEHVVEAPSTLDVELDVSANRKRYVFDRLDLKTLLCKPSAT
jgi:predicted amidohydrolase